MADDTRQQGPSPTNTDKAFAGDQWNEAQQSHKPPDNANLLAASASQHTAGGATGDVTVVDAAKSISPESFAKFPRKPCVRESLLVGITAGFAVGSTRAIWRAPIHVASNWAVGTFCLGAFSMYQYCQYQRHAEKEGMQRAIEIIDRKQLERKQKEARLERIREMRRQKKEEEQDQTFAKLHEENDGQPAKSSWKFW